MARIEELVRSEHEAPIADAAARVGEVRIGTGSASTFVLVPHRLAAIFGPEPQFFIAPVRDILISLPADVERGFAAWLMREFAELDPNFLAPVGFAFRGGAVSVELLEEAVAMRSMTV